MTNKASLHTLRRILLILAGSVLMAGNINTFVLAGGLIPGGFTGLTLLIQKICLQYGKFQIPFSVILLSLNMLPAAVCFKCIGKKFTLYSCLMVVVSGLLTDWIPRINVIISFIQIHDTLLSAIFGGILNAVSITLCLRADATSGGTDFIAIFISEKYHREAWNYIFVGNCIILGLAGWLFSLDKALYSIIFQFTTTMALSSFYHGYQQRTLFIITNAPEAEAIYALIRDSTHHGVTSFDGLGYYEKKRRTLLYSVVSADEVAALISAIRKIDPMAFINILKTEQINGRFFKRAKD